MASIPHNPFRALSNKIQAQRYGNPTLSRPELNSLSPKIKFNLQHWAEETRAARGNELDQKQRATLMSAYNAHPAFLDYLNYARYSEKQAFNISNTLRIFSGDKKELPQLEQRLNTQLHDFSSKQKERFDIQHVITTLLKYADSTLTFAQDEFAANFRKMNSLFMDYRNTQDELNKNLMNVPQGDSDSLDHRIRQQLMEDVNQKKQGFETFFAKNIGSLASLASKAAASYTNQTPTPEASSNSPRVRR